MSTIKNDPESQNLSREELEIFEAARVAAGSLMKTFDLWMAMAEGVRAARDRADRIGGRSTFQRILEQQGLSTALGNTWAGQKSTANKLLAILEQRSSVEEWRDSLTKHQRISWAAPTTLYKHCPLFKKAIDIEAAEDAANVKSMDGAVAEIQGEPSGSADWSQGPHEALTSENDQLKTENRKLLYRIQELEAENAVLKAQLASHAPSNGAAEAVETDLAERGEALEKPKRKQRSDKGKARKAKDKALEVYDTFMSGTTD